MLYKYLRSNKGFTLTEIMIVVVVLGILTAVATPLFHGVLYIQKRNDCKNNRKMIEATIEQAMLGMMDNGRPQRLHDDGDYSDDLQDDKEYNDENPLTMFFWKDISSLTTIEYKGKTVKCFKLTDNEEEKNLIFTLSDIRGGWNGRLDYWLFKDSEEKTTPESYKKWCLSHYNESSESDEMIPKEENRFYLKKRTLGAVPFYTYLGNGECPKCPFSDDYTYYILSDGTCICTECQ